MCIILRVLVDLVNGKVTKRTIPQGCRNNCRPISCCNAGCEELKTSIQTSCRVLRDAARVRRLRFCSPGLTENRDLRSKPLRSLLSRFYLKSMNCSKQL